MELVGKNILGTSGQGKLPMQPTLGQHVILGYATSICSVPIKPSRADPTHAGSAQVLDRHVPHVVERLGVARETR